MMRELTEPTIPGEQPGLVVSYFGNRVAVEAADGQIFQCHLRRNQDLPIVGDKVIWQLNTPDAGIIIKLLPRTSVLAKGNGREKMKPIAANIDVMVIVMAPPPIFSEYLIDRYLVAAELLNIKSIIVLNKTDLLDEAAKERADARLNVYEKIGYPIDSSSVYREGGLQNLSRMLTGKRAVLVGPSGVGKSSIIAALCRDEIIRIGEVSLKGAGKHTTTATRLYHLPGGGSLIDSPGVREFNLWPVSKKEILSGFIEMTPYLGKCKFRNCQHTSEPNCMVRTAVEDGKIDGQRLINYHTLIKEVP